jgi:hypothetical protein
MTNRRNFIKSATAGLLTAASFPNIFSATSSKSYFTLGKVKGRWLFKDPKGNPFFSVALNHFDSATLRYPENEHIWKEKYGNDQIRWIKEGVVPHLKDWGFNSVGWVQEVTVKQQAHSANWSYEEYQALNMPYFHMLPFIETHSWNPWHKNADLRSSAFEDWCDYVARSNCTRFRDDPNLIGYWYSDCPTWTWNRPHNKWRGPMFDPEKLKSEAGRRELYDLARHYYQVTHDAIKRYDPNHLIMGDRYEANMPLPMEVVNASEGLVDVISFQDFKDPATHLAEWHKKTGRPVLWADGAQGAEIHDHTGRYPTDKYKENSGAWYSEMLEGLKKNKGAVGAHLCGAYLRNRQRARGLLGEQEEPDTANNNLIREANQDMNKWVKTFA